MAVKFSSRIYKSSTTSITAIETGELHNLKNYITELEEKIKEMMAASQQEKITLGVPKQHLGE